jgi:hypothetical protein
MCAAPQHSGGLAIKVIILASVSVSLCAPLFLPLPASACLCLPLPLPLPVWRPYICLSALRSECARVSVSECMGGYLPQWAPLLARTPTRSALSAVSE